MKDKFMDSMMEKMSFAEKKAMMNDMMDKFFAGFSNEEKQDLMKEMMAKMAEGAGPGSATGNPMTQMMGMMMRTPGEEECNPMDMCKQMMENMGRESDKNTFITGEIRGLFEEWARQMDDEIVGLLKSGVNDVDQLAARLKISPQSLIYFLARLAQQGKLKLEPVLQ